MNLNYNYKKPDWAPGMLSAQRITALDLARFLAMIMMIQGHSLDSLASPLHLDINIFPWNVWHFLRGFTAQVFLMISGTVHIFANKRQANGLLSSHTIKRRIKMAFLLIIIGYLLMFPANKIWDLPFIEPKYLISFFQVGILQLIGVTLLMVLALFLLTKNDKATGRFALVIAIIISLLSPFVHAINWFNYLPEFIASYFSFEHGSLFPIFPYSSFMFYGIFLGSLLKKREPEDRLEFLITKSAPIGFLLVLLGYGLTWLFEIMKISIITKAHPGAILYQIGFVLIGLGFCSFLYKKTKKLSFYYAMFGKRALFIYVLHLIILYGTPWFQSIGKIYHKSLPVSISIILAISVEIITLGLVYFYEYSTNKYPKTKKIYIYGLSSVVLFLLLIGNIFKW